MIVNFRTSKLSRDTYKLTRTFTLIKINHIKGHIVSILSKDIFVVSISTIRSLVGPLASRNSSVSSQFNFSLIFTLSTHVRFLISEKTD